MSGIVEQLATWVKGNADYLRQSGIQLTDKIPEPGSRHPWKASIALSRSGILVSYTVWERKGFQTELIVMNTLTNKTILMDEKAPDDSQIVEIEMDEVVAKILDNTFINMKPDPKLTIL